MTEYDSYIVGNYILGGISAFILYISIYIPYQQRMSLEKELSFLYSSVQLCLFKIKLLEEYNNKKENDNEKT